MIGGLRRFGQDDRKIALLLFVATVGLVAVTSGDIGFTRDEGYYFKAGRDYFGWFHALWQNLLGGDLLASFSKTNIDRHWSYNHEHPVLVKSLFALSYGLLEEGLGVFQSDGQAMRFVGWCFGGLSVSMTYLLGRQLLSPGLALLAALSWLMMPRSFWHMHLACFDIPVVFAHVWLVHTYVKGQDSFKRALWVGVVFGIAASIKHNVLFVPVIFVLHWLLTQATFPTPGRGGLNFPKIPVTFLAMAIVGPIVFVLHWPYLWPDVIGRVGWYFNFHLEHEHYPILYFAELLSAPPFPRAFPFVMTAVTVPIVTLAVMILGLALSLGVLLQTVLGKSARRPMTLRAPASLVLLLVLNALVPFLVISNPDTPIFGGTKHWMNGVPFLCILGAWGLNQALQGLRGNPHFVTLKTATVAAILLPAALLTLRSHPYGLSAYNETVGFARGAANIGFQRTFWGYEPQESWSLINERTSVNGKIHLGDTNQASYRTYIRDRIIRSDLRYSGRVRNSDAASVQPQGEFKKQWIDVWNQWGTRKPAGVVHLDGVPLSTVSFKP